MVGTASKVVVAAGAAGYLGYLARQAVQEETERREAEEAERRLRQERQERWEQAAQEWADRYEEGETDSSEFFRSVLWLEEDRRHWFETLVDLRARAEELAAAKPPRLLTVPLLGEAEGPAALLMGAVLLLGSSQLLDEHIMAPFFTGLWSPVIDVEEMASFGFALSRVSSDGAKLLETWLRDMQALPTLLSLGLGSKDTALMDERMDPLWWVCAGSEEGEGRLMYYTPRGNTHEAVKQNSDSARLLLQALGLYVANASSFRVVVGEEPGTVKVDVGKHKEGHRHCGFKPGAPLGTISNDCEELMVANFPVAVEPFSLGGLSITEDGVRYMRHLAVSCPEPEEPSMALMRMRASLRVEHLHSKVAHLALRRLKKLGGASGWSLEHFASASGEVDMVRWQPQSSQDLEPRDITAIFRENDLRLIDEHEDVLERKLEEQLMEKVPPPAAASEAALRSEVQPFVRDFIQLARARLVQTPLSDQQLTPMEVMGKASAYKKVYFPERIEEEKTGFLGCLLRQAEKERDQRSDELTHVPWHWAPAMAACYVLFVAVVFLLLPWQLSLGFLQRFSLVQRVLGAFPLGLHAVLMASNLASAWWWTHACKQQLKANTLQAALEVCARRAYVFAARQRGWRIPLARDSKEFEERCTAMVSRWTWRLLGRQMSDQSDRGYATPAEALALMGAAASASRKASGRMPMPGSSSEEAQRWLMLPCRQRTEGDGPPPGESDRTDGHEQADSGTSGAARPSDDLGRVSTLDQAVHRALRGTRREAAAAVSAGDRSGKHNFDAEENPFHNSDMEEDPFTPGMASSTATSAPHTTEHTSSPERPGDPEDTGHGAKAQAAAQTVREFLKSRGWGFARVREVMHFKRPAVKLPAHGADRPPLCLSYRAREGALRLEAPAAASFSSSSSETAAGGSAGARRNGLNDPTYRDKKARKRRVGRKR